MANNDLVSESWETNYIQEEDEKINDKQVKIAEQFQ